jgi:hypothetical protein
MSRKMERPTREDGTLLSKHSGREDNAFTESHPAYGMLTVSRMHGLYGPMFGSALPRHDGAVRFEIREGGQRFHDLHSDRYHGGKILLSWYMTNAQFVEVMSQMNRGDGVPITLDYIPAVADGKLVLQEVPGIDWEQDQTEAAEAIKGVEQFGRKLARQVSEIVESTKRELDAAGVSQKKQAAILAPLNRLACDLGPNVRFALDMLQEAGEKVVSAARTEIDAAVSTTVRQLGFQKLDELKAIQEKSQPALPGPIDAESK